ncbi:MAG: hypothetical protein ABIQ93_10960, partial [Saprospiraceae bacterium]
MHYRLLFIVLLLGHIHTAQAQCNPKQYTRIFQEATTLQEKGLFIEAKNTYEAAKIFACNQKEKDAADSRVDALFTQINRLRQQADSTAWTAYANDLAYKSAIALQAGDRNTAFRLAEFAHRYVEADNPGVLQALLDALYHQDIPTRPALPRVENLEGHSERVLSVACSPDGQWLATGGDDGLAIIWDLVSKKPIFSLFCFGTVNSLAFSPDGSQLATATGNHTTLIWDLYSGKTRQTLEGHDYRILGVAFSPDGKRLATASDDKTAIIWDIENG